MVDGGPAECGAVEAIEVATGAFGLAQRHFGTADQAARFHDQALDIVEMPDDRRAARHRLPADDVLHHRPERTHAVLGDPVVIFLPDRFDVVLAAGLGDIPLGSLPCSRIGHAALSGKQAMNYIVRPLVPERT